MATNGYGVDGLGTTNYVGVGGVVGDINRDETYAAFLGVFGNQIPPLYWLAGLVAEYGLDRQQSMSIRFRSPQPSRRCFQTSSANDRRDNQPTY